MHIMVSDVIPSCNEHKSRCEPRSLSRECTSDLPLCPVPVCLVGALSIPHCPCVIANIIDPSISVSPIWGYKWSAIQASTIQWEAEWVVCADLIIKRDMTIVVDLQDCDSLQLQRQLMNRMLNIRLMRHWPNSSLHFFFLFSLQSSFNDSPTHRYGAV